MCQDISAILHALLLTYPTSVPLISSDSFISCLAIGFDDKNLFTVYFKQNSSRALSRKGWSALFNTNPKFTQDSHMNGHDEIISFNLSKIENVPNLEPSENIKKTPCELPK